MIRYITNSFKWFFKLEAASGLVLLFAAIIALIISYIQKLSPDTIGPQLIITNIIL